MPRTSPALALVLALLASPSPAAGAEAGGASGLPPGDWIGWGYLDGGGDLPLRIRVGRTDGVLSVRFDELVSARYDLPAEVSWDPPHLVVTRTRPTGSRLVLEGDVTGSTIRGRFDWAGSAGDFELTRSPLAIARIPPERFAGLTGTYRLGPQRSLVVSARFWGELVATDLATGRYATLLPTDTDSFFVGGALYLPEPVQARVRFLRDEEGEAVEVEWRESGGRVLSGPRLALVEEPVAFESDGDLLAGSLVRPAGRGPVPAAVVIPGSSWSDREAGRRDAEILASFGMAALIYDKRGNGESAGDPVVPFQQTARDAAAALAYLTGRDGLLRDQVGFTGRSRGGWIAPLAATLAPDASFLVLFVPPAVSPAAQETTRRLHLLEDEGVCAERRAIAETMLRSAWRYAATGEGWGEYARNRERALAAGLPDEVFEPATADDPEWEWTRLNMAYDPVPALETLTLPVLALFGENDRNVVPADNLPVMRAALERAGNRDVELLVVPGADHGLQATAAGAPLPLHRRVGFGSSGWPEVARWLKAHLDLAPPAR